MSYEAETKADERAVSQELRLPRPVGDVMTEEDLVLWEKQK